jgi:sarcosine oxidase
MTQSFEVIVIGGGAWGSAATQHLATRKRKVLCIDRYRPPHSLGSTHGHSRLINSNAETSSHNLPLIRRSYELWRQLEKESGLDLMQRVGYLFVGSPGSQRMARSLESLRDSKLPQEELSGDEIRKRFPEFQLRADEVGIFDPDASRLDPEACVKAALQIAERNGAVLRFDERALEWRVSGEGVVVETSQGRYQADRLVLALGGWTPSLSKVTLPLWIERQVMVWFADDEPALAGFSFPADAPATSLYGVPEAGGKVKVALHHGGPPTEPDAVAPVSDADIEAVRMQLAERVPRLTKVLSSATCFYTNSPDSQYVLGRHPSSERVLLLAAGSGRGFHQAQVVGEFAADYVEGRSRPDIDWLSPTRFAETAEERSTASAT